MLVSIQDVDGVKTFSDFRCPPAGDRCRRDERGIAERAILQSPARSARVAELQIINSVQEGLAKQLDFQGIIDLVGDKVGEIFNADTTNLTMFDVEREWIFECILCGSW